MKIQICRLTKSASYLLLIVLASALAGAPTVQGADDTKPSPPNSVYAKIILPAKDADEGEHPAVESWISGRLRKRGETELTSVTNWFRLAEEGGEVKHIRTATATGPGRKCPAIGRVVERTADGKVRVMVCWLSPSAPKIQGNTLPDEIGSRGVAVVEAGSGYPNKAYVALLVGPPPVEATQDRAEKKAEE